MIGKCVSPDNYIMGLIGKGMSSINFAPVSIWNLNVISFKCLTVQASIFIWFISLLTLNVLKTFTFPFFAANL